MNKKLLFLHLMILLGLKGFAQCNPLSYDTANPVHTNISTILELDIKADFCAVGDSITNDQKAFEAASDFITKRGGYCKLIIPEGMYRVGKQIKTASRYLSTRNFVLSLQFTNQVEIAGVGTPVIKFADSLRYGYFDTLTGAPMDIDGSWSQLQAAKVAADLGHIIYLQNSKNIKISGLTLDGNLYPGRMIIGGRNIDNFLGIQELFSGICLWVADSVQISNVVSNRMGLDGFLLWEGANRVVTIENCLADYNGRQGLSIVDGRDVFISNSRFMHSGMGELIYTGLQAGVDLEPENVHHVVKNVHFNDCSFEDCRNTAVAISSGLGTASDIYFNNCLLQNANDIGNSVALDIGRHKNVEFRDCKLYGYVTISSADSAKALGEGFSFFRCLFSDCYHRMVTTPSGCVMVREPMALTSTALIYNYEDNAQRYLEIDSCIFDTYTKRPWVSLRNDSSAPSTISRSIIYVNGETGTDIPNSAMFNTILQDDDIKLDNNRFYMHPDQCYLHGVDTISGPTPTISTNTWLNNTFYRWTIDGPKGTCADTIPCSGIFQQPSVAPGSERGADLKISVYPNPSNGIFTIQFGKKVKNANIRIQSMEGRLMHRQIVKGWSAQVNLSAVPSGIYFVIVSEEGRVAVMKIVRN